MGLAICCAESDSTVVHAHEDDLPLITDFAPVTMESMHIIPKKFKVFQDGVHSEGGEFLVSLSREEDRREIGLRMDASNPRCVTVKLVGDGPVCIWNKLNPERAVRPGDSFVEVNGCRSADDIVKALYKDETLDIRVVRVHEFTIALKKIKCLGFWLQKDKMVISDIVDKGALEAYNESCLPGRMVVPGDEIVEVNERRGSHEDLLRELVQAQGQVSLRIRHPRIWQKFALKSSTTWATRTSRRTSSSASRS